MKHNWEYKRLGDVCDVIGGSTPKTGIPEFWNGNLNWFTPAEISEKKYYASSERKITEEAVKATGLTPMPPGTVLLTSRAPIGKVGIVTEYCYCNQGFKNLVCKDSLFNEYLYHALIYYNDDIKEKGRGATFKEISKKVTESITIPVPPMKVQKQIVAELDQINDLIAKNRELLSQLDALAQSLFYDTFGDPITNPKGWRKNQLRDLCDIVGRIGFRGYTRNDLVGKGEGAITLSPSNIVNGYLNYDNCSYISWYKYDESPEIKIYNGDILLTKTGSTVGKVGCVFNLPEKATINPQLVVLKNLSINNRYVTFTLRDSAYQDIIREKAGGSAVPTISQKILATISIPVPPLVLQEDFAAKVEAIEAQKAKVEAEIAELQTLLDARMDYWFND